MSNRREFSKAVQVAIRKRATRDNMVRYCELCNAQAMRGEVHHVEQDAMQIDKSRKLTVADGIYLCIPCHKAINEKQEAEYAKVLRVEARFLGARKPHVQKIASPPRAPRSTAKLESIRRLGPSPLMRRAK